MKKYIAILCILLLVLGAGCSALNPQDGEEKELTTTDEENNNKDSNKTKDNESNNTKNKDDDGKSSNMDGFTMGSESLDRWDPYSDDEEVSGFDAPDSAPTSYQLSSSFGSPLTYKNLGSEASADGTLHFVVYNNGEAVAHRPVQGPIEPNQEVVIPNEVTESGDLLLLIWENDGEIMVIVRHDLS